MGSPKNVTQGISKLRGRSKPSPVLGEQPAKPKRGKGSAGRQAATKPVAAGTGIPERRLAINYFMIFAYTLIALSVLTQFFLIVWLDLF